MGCFCGCCCRAGLIIFGVFAFIVGIADIGFSAYKAVEAPKDFEKFHTYRLSGEVKSPDLSLNFYEFSLNAYYVILGAGCGLLFLSLFGIIATCKTNRCCMGLMTALTILLSVASIIALVYYVDWYNGYQKNITASLQESIKLRYNVSGHEEITDAWNKVMHNETCCGGAGPEDFIERTLPNATDIIDVDEITCRADSRYPRRGCAKFLQTTEIDATNLLQLIMFGLQLAFSMVLALFALNACLNTKDKRSKKGKTDSYDVERKR